MNSARERSTDKNTERLTQISRHEIKRKIEKKKKKKCK